MCILENVEARIVHLDRSWDSLVDAVDGPGLLGTFSTLLDELEFATAEEPDVEVAHHSEWLLSVYSGGRLFWGNLVSGEDRFMEGVSQETILDLMRLTALGDFAAIEAFPWRTGL